MAESAVPDFFKQASEEIANEGKPPVTPEPKPEPQAKAPEQKPEEKSQEVPEAKAAEKPATEPAAKAEEKPAETPEGKEWYDDDANSPEEKLDGLKKEDRVKETEKLREKAKEYEELSEDPIIKMLIEAKKAGADLLTTINSLKERDYDKVPADELFEIELSKHTDLTDEEKDLEREEFKNLSPLQKKKQADAIRKELKAAQSEKLKTLSLDNKKSLERQSQITEKANVELDSYTGDLVGKNFLGVKITKEMVDELKSEVKQGFNVYREDGTYNIPYLWQLHFQNKHIKTIVKANIATAKNLGRKEVLDEVSKPSKVQTESRLPTESGISEDQKAVAGFVGKFVQPQSNI